MEKRALGTSGWNASMVGLGGNNFGMKIDLAATHAVIDTPLDAGINFFDTADLYGGTKSEDFIGQVLGPRRKEVGLATKFGGVAYMQKKGEHWGARADIVKCGEASLQRLRTEWIDLYQIHFPDATMPIEETLAALDDGVRQGKVRAIGSSNFSNEQINEVQAQSQNRHLVHFVTAQNEWSLLNREVEREVIPACEKHNVGQLPYFPLAGGLLTGKYRRGEALVPGSRLATLDYFTSFATDERFAKVEALQSFAQQCGHTLLELAMSWLAGQPSVTSVIAGATPPEQIRANAAAVNWKLSSTELAEVEALVPLARS